jgi:hypothetical protein
VTAVVLDPPAGVSEYVYVPTAVGVTASFERVDTKRGKVVPAAPTLSTADAIAWFELPADPPV